MNPIAKAMAKKMGSGMKSTKVNKSVGMERHMRKDENKGEREDYSHLKGEYSKK